MALHRVTDGSTGDAAAVRRESLRAAADAISRLARVVQDFPVPGVLFRDLTPVLADAEALPLIGVGLATAVDTPFDLVAGLDARGFLFGTAVAMTTGTGVLSIRKAGKLAGDVIGVDYDLEYGTARIELHPDDVPNGSRVLIVDDVLATGGTAAAAIGLLRRAGAEVVGVAVAMELLDLGGATKLDGVPLGALISL